MRWIFCIESNRNTHRSPCYIVSPQSNRNTQTLCNTKAHIGANTPAYAYSNAYKENLYVLLS